MGTQKLVPGLDWTSVPTAAAAWLRAARTLRVGWSRNVLECYDSPWRFEFWMSQVVSSVCPQEHHTLWSQGCWQHTSSSQAEQGPGGVGAVSESMNHPKQ